MRINSSVINVYKKNNIKSEVVTQPLYGHTFKKIKKNGLWIKIKNDKDNYKGYIKNNNFLRNEKNTHKICSISTQLYSKPNKKNKIKKKLSFGSKIKISKERGAWKELIINNKTYLTMITFHPAYLLRQADQKKYSWADLKEIRKKVDELKLKI